MGRWQAYAVEQGRVGGSAGSRQAASPPVKFPAMIRTGNPLGVDDALGQGGSPMGAAFGQQSQSFLGIAKQDQPLSQQGHPLMGR